MSHVERNGSRENRSRLKKNQQFILREGNKSHGGKKSHVKNVSREKFNKNVKNSVGKKSYMWGGKSREGSNDVKSILEISQAH